MPSTITPVDAYTSPITVPADNDAGNAASVNVPFQALADRIEWLKERALGGKASAVYRVPLIALANPSSRFNFQVSAAFNSSYVWRQANVTDAGLLVIPIPMPFVKGRLTKLTAHLQAASGHANLPGTKPTLNLIRTPYDGSAPAAFTPVTDPSASVVAYQARHTIEHLLGGGVDIDNTHKHIWYALFTGETGSDSAVNLDLAALELTVEPIA